MLLLIPIAHYQLGDRNDLFDWPVDRPRADHRHCRVLYLCGVPLDARQRSAGALLTQFAPSGQARARPDDTVSESRSSEVRVRHEDDPSRAPCSLRTTRRSHHRRSNPSSRAVSLHHRTAQRGDTQAQKSALPVYQVQCGARCYASDVGEHGGLRPTHRLATLPHSSPKPCLGELFYHLQELKNHAIMTP